MKKKDALKTILRVKNRRLVRIGVCETVQERSHTQQLFSLFPDLFSTASAPPTALVRKSQEEFLFEQRLRKLPIRVYGESEARIHFQQERIKICKPLPLTRKEFKQVMAGVVQQYKKIKRVISFKDAAWLVETTLKCYKGRKAVGLESDAPTLWSEVNHGPLWLSSLVELVFQETRARMKTA